MKPHKERRSAAKVARNANILEQAMSGKQVQDIAKDMGMGRSTVSKILNSDEMKAKIASINAQLAAGIDGAIQTVLNLSKEEYEPARDLLRNFGAMQPKVEVEHSGKVTLEGLVAGANESEDAKD